MPTAQAREYDELMDLLDNVFFLEDPQPKRDFRSLLPKLYKEQYRPWDNNYCVYEGEALKAAVGMYVSEVEVAGVPLRMGGIGNVAVARDSRRKGYMKAAMDEAMAAMKAAGCAFGELGGQRQRYQCWGFERGGAVARASISETNLRHAYGDNPLPEGWRAEEIKPEDTETIALAQALVESAAVHVRHDPAAFYDYLCSWQETPYAIWEGKALRGLFTLSREKKHVGQFFPLDPEYLEPALRAAFAVLPEDDSKSLGLAIPLWERELLAKCEEIAEDVWCGDSGQFVVFDWVKTLHALLLLQAKCKPLPEGELNVSIDNNVHLRIKVQSETPSVEIFDGKPELSLTHMQAQRFFLAQTSTARDAHPLAQAWFPLPLFLWGIDKV